MSEESATIDAAPTRSGTVVALALEILGVLAVAAAGIAVALPPALFGFVLVLAGLRRGQRRHVTLGAGLGGGAVIAAGAFGGATVAVLGATICFALAWDAAETALTNGESMGPTGVDARSERRHLAATAAVLLVGAGASYVVYRIAAGTLPVSALLALLVGGGLVLLVLRS